MFYSLLILPIDNIQKHFMRHQILYFWMNFAQTQYRFQTYPIKLQNTLVSMNEWFLGNESAQ